MTENGSKQNKEHEDQEEHEQEQQQHLRCKSPAADSLA
jgi:hypothetical protein